LALHSPGPVAMDGGRSIIVIPCYNEAARLRTEEFREFSRSAPSIHFIFVNDGSSDATWKVLNDMRIGHENAFLLIDKQPNAGKAEAVRAGMLLALDFADTKAVGFWDGDLATPLDAIPALLRKLETQRELEMVFGSRVRLLGRDVRRKASRHYLGRVFATFASIVLGLPIYDTQCGAKLFRVTPRLRDVLRDPFLSKWVFDVEILARFIQGFGSKRKQIESLVYEYPLDRWEDIHGSKVRARDFFTAFWDLLLIYYTYLQPARRHTGQIAADMQPSDVQSRNIRH
jgi:dolichyl-phosphate beta-glucosyltransferase